MTTIATRKRDIAALKTLLAARAKIAKLEAKIAVLKTEADSAAMLLKTFHPEGVALELPRGKAKIVQFSRVDRQYVDMEKVRKMLGERLPHRTTKVSITRIYDGVIE